MWRQYDNPTKRETDRWTLSGKWGPGVRRGCVLRGCETALIPRLYLIVQRRALRSERRTILERRTAVVAAG